MGIVVSLSGDQAKPEKQAQAKTASALDRLQALTAADMARVNQAILAKMDSPVPLIPQLAGHLIESGGKRLRPLLTLATAKMCGYEGGRHINLAVCVEFIHTATLLHDDVVDRSNLRRGTETANVLWGNQASVLVGDFLFSRAFQLMVADGSLDVLKILSDASSTIAEGEVLQLTTAHDIGTTEDSYLRVIKAKTAALFAAACQVGAVVAERSQAKERALEGYGRNLGIAFQLVDDALDYTARQQTLGKTIGDDFREGKVTLPVILAYCRGNEEERRFWRRTITRGKQQDGDLEQAIAIMSHHQALADTVERARHYGAIARDALGIFPDGEIKNTLSGIIDFCTERGY